MSPSTTNRFKSNQPPPLPQQGFNPLLLNYKGKIRSVRTQDINLAPTSTITIARVKIPAPDKISTHLIKRFDTDAVSATSFYKSAFPHSSEEDEAIQMDYLHKIYDTHNAGALDLGPDHRLTGVWVPTQFASELAEAYGLTRFAEALIAYPNPNAKPSSKCSPNQSLLSSSEAIGSNHPQTPKSGPNGDHHKLLNGHITKPSDQQVPATRSSKRSRVAPPCFGNTSPSTFNLTTSLSKPSTTQANQVDKPTGSGHSPTPASTHLHHHYQKDAKLVQYSSRSTTTVESHPTPVLSPTKTSDLRGGDGVPSQLVGTDEEVRKAQQDALELVSSIRSSSLESRSKSTTTTTNQMIERDSATPFPPRKEAHDDIGGPKGMMVNRKRSADETLEAESDRQKRESNEAAAEEEEVEKEEEEVLTNEKDRSTRHSFLPKLLWRRSGEAIQRREEILQKHKKKKQQQQQQHRTTDSHPRPHVPLAGPTTTMTTTGPVDPSLSPGNLTKRNLAIAGIVIAGAAASIAPYFF